MAHTPPLHSNLSPFTLVGILHRRIYLFCTDAYRAETSGWLFNGPLSLAKSRTSRWKTNTWFQKSGEIIYDFAGIRKTEIYERKLRVLGAEKESRKWWHLKIQEIFSPQFNNGVHYFFRQSWLINTPKKYSYFKCIDDAFQVGWHCTDKRI